MTMCLLALWNHAPGYSVRIVPEAVVTSTDRTHTAAMVIMVDMVEFFDSLCIRSLGIRIISLRSFFGGFPLPTGAMAPFSVAKLDPPPFGTSIVQRRRLLLCCSTFPPPPGLPAWSREPRLKVNGRLMFQGFYGVENAFNFST